MMNNQLNKIGAMKRAANKTIGNNDALLADINTTRLALLAVQKELQGDPVKDEIGERSNPTPNNGNRIAYSALNNTYGPTANHKTSLNRAKKQLQGIKAKLKTLANSTAQIEQRLKAAGAPWIEGQGLIRH